MDPYLKPSWGLGYALKIETRYSWEPNQPGNVVTGIRYNNFDTSTDTLYPRCEWTVPSSEDYEVIAAFPLYETEHSPAIKYYVCFEARFLDFTASSYHLMTKWTIRTPDTRAWYADLASPLDTSYSIPDSGQSLTTPELYFNWEFINQVLYIGLTIQCMGSYDYGGQTYLYNLPVGIALCPSLIDTRYGYFDSDRAVTPIEDPNELDPGGPSGPGGGDGSHTPIYTPIPIPGLPTIGPNSAGFVYMLRMTKEQMNDFAGDMLHPDWWTALKNLFADPMDFICGIMIVPYEPEIFRYVTPKIGNNYMGHSYPQIFNQFKEIDCGRLYVDKYFGSCFDNNPYTHLLVWLPYIGYRELDPDECVGKTLHIVYHCDCMSGDCVCFIATEAGSPPLIRVVYQFSGNCGVRVPFGTTSYDAAIAASVQLLGGAVGAIAGGAIAGPAGIAAGEIGASQIANSIAGSTVSAVNGSKVTTERSGVAGATAGYLSIQYPYLLRTVPQQSLPTNYAKLEGYPANIAGPLANFSGFAAVETIDLNGIAATKEELNEIEQLLRGGVYI